MLPKWEDRFSIHNNEIDAQHKKLFELAHKAYALEYKKTSRVEIREILSEFFEYMKVHFKDEESYMESIGYPGLEDHKKLHKKIIEELSKTIKSIHNVHDMKEKLVIVAQDWLLSHILHDDMLIERHRLKLSVKPMFGEERKEEDPDRKYYYGCGCKDKIRTVPKKMHLEIQSGLKVFRCSVCKQEIALIEDELEESENTPPQERAEA